MYTRVVVSVLFAVAVTVNMPTAQSLTLIQASNLTTPISRTGCGKDKLCVSKETACDPSTSGCFFASAKLQNNNTYQFELSGTSDGYIALAVSPNGAIGNNDTTYVCAKNNSNISVDFFTALVNNKTLIQGNQNTTSVNGSVNGTKIQCTFATEVLPPTTKSLSVTLYILNGTYNSGTLGDPGTIYKESITDLSNPGSNILNTTTAPSTATNTTTNHGITLQQSLTQALLITVSALCLAMM